MKPLKTNPPTHPSSDTAPDRSGSTLERQCDINIARTIDLANAMIRLAHTGYEQREDPDCGVLYGILLDSGYRVLELAQKEKHMHMQKGWWANAVKNR
jgi:hypothetical protein